MTLEGRQVQKGPCSKARQSRDRVWKDVKGQREGGASKKVEPVRGGAVRGRTGERAGPVRGWGRKQKVWRVIKEL